MDRAQSTVGQFQQSSPQEVRIRTFASDLRSIRESGTGIPQFQSVALGPLPRPPSAPRISVKMIAYIVLSIIILAALGVWAYLIGRTLK